MPLKIIRNDITKMQVDAIVNTANPEPRFSRGSDAAVYEAAGMDELLAERAAIGRIEPGHSALTAGYKLPAPHIIHTVATDWCDGKSGEEDIIRSCYRSVFDIVVKNGFESVAMPLLASGACGFPKGIALRIALSEIEKFLDVNDIELFLVVFDDKSFTLSEEMYGDIDEYISANYIEEKLEEEYCEEPTLFGGSKNSEKRSGSKFRMQARCMADVSVDFPETNANESSGLQSECTMSAVSKAGRSLDDVVNNLDKTFMELVFTFADEKGLTDAEIQRRAGIDRRTFSKLRCGTTKNPSKATALSLAIALRLNLDETKDLLSRAGYALAPCSKQDVIVQYFIERGAYNIDELNIILYNHGVPVLNC